MRLKKDLDIFSIDKHQELDLPSQVHVEEDEDEVDEDEGIYLFIYPVKLIFSFFLKKYFFSSNGFMFIFEYISKFRILDEVPNEVEEHSQGRSPSPNSSKAEQPDAAPPTTSTTTGGHTTGSVTVFPRLMESIHATKDIGDHTVFGGSDVPPLGVVTEHQAELEKVISRKKKIINFQFSPPIFSRNKN